MTAWVSMGLAMIGIDLLILIVSAIKDSEDAAWFCVVLGFTGIAFLIWGLFS